VIILATLLTAFAALDGNAQQVPQIGPHFTCMPKELKAVPTTSWTLGLPNLRHGLKAHSREAEQATHYKA